MRIITYFAIILSLLLPATASAGDWYAGATFIHSGETDACIIVRFKSSDGSFTLDEANTLYATIATMIANQDLGSVTVNNVLPSTNEANGVSGDYLSEIFLSSGTGVCLSEGEPVDAVGFLSAFRCEYQNQNQMCFRVYVDTGEFDLSSLGIPQGPTGIGGIFIKREVWDTTFALILNNSSLSVSSGSSTFSSMLEPLAETLLPVLPFGR